MDNDIFGLDHHGRAITAAVFVVVVRAAEIARRLGVDHTSLDLAVRQPTLDYH